MQRKCFHTFHQLLAKKTKNPIEDSVASILQSNSKHVNKILRGQKEEQQKSTLRSKKLQVEEVIEAEKTVDEDTGLPPIHSTKSKQRKPDEPKPFMYPGEVEVNLLEMEGDYSQFKGLFPNSPDEIEDSLARKINLLFPNNKLVSDDVEQEGVSALFKRLATLNAGYNMASPDFKIYWGDLFKKKEVATKEEKELFDMVNNYVNGLEASYKVRVETLDFEDDNFEGYIRSADERNQDSAFYQYFKLNFDISEEERKDEEKYQSLGYSKLENLHFLYTFDSPFTTEYFPSTFDGIEMEDETMHFDFPYSDKKRSDTKEEQTEDSKKRE